MSKTVLIVDDELDIQSSLSLALKDEGYEVFTATLPHEAEKILASYAVDLALYDVWFPQGDGIELLKKTRAMYPKTTAVMMSGHGNIELALKAIKLGAYDFLEKPLELERVLVVLRNAAEAQTLRSENQRLVWELAGSHAFLGDSNPVRNLRNSIERAAGSSAHVLILGENGSGKELVAHLLHGQSSRSEKAFVAVNCAAIPENLFESVLFGHEKGAFTGATSRSLGRFELAGQGTLFLDEISELSPAAQAKLLRVLEDRKFERVGGRQVLKAEARILAATNKDLVELVKEGKFREDLYFRLKVLVVTVPPLRERLEDLPVLVEYFLKNFSVENRRSKPHLDDELLKFFQNYDWPGNVRELRNLLERMLIMSPPDSGRLLVSDLPEDLSPPSRTASQGKLYKFLKDAPEDFENSLRELRAQFERSVLENRLKHFEKNVTRAAESLGIERAHLHRKIRQLGIEN